MQVTDLGIITPDEGLRAEERLLREGRDSIIIYSRDMPTVSLGRFNVLDESVDTDFAERNGITVVRRISGGSAIYSDSGQLVFSVVTDRSRFASKMDSYETLCNCLVRTLAHLGIDAEYKPRNDVLVNGMKISGCAQYRDRERILHHGTLILRLDSVRMDGVLKRIKERSYPRLTSVEETLGHIPKREEIVEAFEKGFELR